MVARSSDPDILRKFSNSKHVSINISGSVYLHDTDTELAVLELLSDFQIRTNQFDDLSLDLVRYFRLRLPDYLLANTFDKKVTSEKKISSTEDDESPFKWYPGPNFEHAKWTRL